MIEKMNFLSITGPKEDIDRVIEEYIARYDMQLEPALSELKNVKDLYPYTDTNPYREVFQSAEELRSLFQYKEKEAKEVCMSPRDVESCMKFVETVSREVGRLRGTKQEIERRWEEYRLRLSKIEQFIGLDYDMSDILHFEFIRFRFGRFEKEYYEKFMDYVYDGVDSVFHKCSEVEGYVWGVYFVPDAVSERVDAIYAALRFERFFLPEGFEGTPAEASEALRARIRRCDRATSVVEERISRLLKGYREEFLAVFKKLQAYTRHFEIRKLAACTKAKERTFYILCGWMAEKDAEAFQKEIEGDKNTFCVIENDHSNLSDPPPIKLKNGPLFGPFEMFVEMYGLPEYHELDPTPLIGLTYSILFGFMFGDVGQGLVLMVAGAVLAYLKKSRLAAIIARCGVFSMIFGFMFGSVFGFENLLKPIWLHPAHDMRTVPFVGNINTVFLVAIGAGMGLLLVTMIINMVNRLRVREPGEALFDANGLTGMFFYGTILFFVVTVMRGEVPPSGPGIALLFVLPLVLVFFKEPLTHLLERRSPIFPKEKGMFFVQGFFELFELLLGYFSNTLSFVRVGAFAVSHAAMMQVVLMLAGVERGQTNWVAVILGNLFVMGMEGLIVGIQVLRLEYYEMFSRFYHGGGRAFAPYGKD